MKITKKQLRKLIKEMAWDPSLSTGAHPNFVNTRFGDTPESVKGSKYYQEFLQGDNKDQQRALGLLSKTEAEKEKTVVRDYQRVNQIEISKFHKELKKPLKEAQITCLHAPSYEGTVTQKQYGVTVASWIERFGSSNKDQISTVMIPGKISEMYKYLNAGGPNVDDILKEGYSFILGGYPVMMNYDDMMTQTLSNLHPELIKFQSGSGLSKSTGKTPDIDNYQNFIAKNEISDETVLDNWFIKGVHFTVYDSLIYPSMAQESLEELSKIAEECKARNLPLYVTDAGDLSKGTYKYS